MFGYENREIIPVSVSYDPTADEVYPLFVAPMACEIKSAYAIVVNDVAANTADYFSLSLLNGGTAGSGTAVLAAAIGGTPGWTGLLPVAFTMAQGTLAAGELVTLKYDEEGTATFTQMTVQLEVIYGLGADA